jgi:alpha-1,6-mannosyltransferase
VSSRSALPEVVGAAGLAADDNDAACADAIERLLRRDETERRRLARARAERFGWPAAVDGFLGAHGLAPCRAGRVAGGSAWPRTGRR